MIDLSELKGIGAVRLNALHAAGICSLRDLLSVLPVRYRDLRETIRVSEASSGETVTMRLKRVGEASLSFYKGNPRVSCTFSDENGDRIKGVWFRQIWMKNLLNNGTAFLMNGVVSEYANGIKQLTNPRMEHELRILPVYRPIEGITQKLHEALVTQALSRVGELFPERLPRELVERFDFLSSEETIRILHSPQDMESLSRAQKRYAFEQMLLYQASVRLVRDLRREAVPIAFHDKLAEDFWQMMPYRPTDAQARTLCEIGRDLAKPKAMARMVQGDVGSGKTAVAMGAMLFCLAAGYQCALMAPTEILAQQHFESMRPFFEKRGYICELLVGGMETKEHRRVMADLASGACGAVIGTHALISKSVQYKNLALCITDEQHRFGVAQRTALIEKGSRNGTAPHLLVMSATPIPRSLALVLFGDLDLSVIDQLPPGRSPVQTRIVPEAKREDMYRFVSEEIAKGRQAYFVCPLVEKDDKTDALRSVKEHASGLQSGPFRDLRVGLTYGSQPAHEKAETLAAFSRGEIDILVSTTVIEVGVNVPNASVMVIEDADRYGLAQLHQLRGRVGRGEAQSWCFLLARPNERLRTLTRTHDGFEVAREDLAQRGPGELLGMRQSGADAFVNGMELFTDMQTLYDAAACAEELQTNPEKAEQWSAVCALAREKIGRMSDRVSIS